MKFHCLHGWDIDFSAAIALQQQLSPQVELKDRVPTPLKWVAGVDVSCRWQSRLFHAAVVVLEYPSMLPHEIVSASMEIDFPYVPGLLSFRELPVILQALEKLQRVPDLVLVDGQGIAHPRGLGLASHLGLWLDLPTIGCAKTRLFGAHAEVALTKGSRTPLLNPAGLEIGTLLRTRQGIKPLYVSPGHRLSVATATDFLLSCGGRYRLPEPIRAAHQASNQQRLRWEAQQGQDGFPPEDSFS